MRWRLLSMLQSRMPPPFVVGVLVAVMCVAVETVLAEFLRPIVPVRSLGLVYLLGILAVAALWGLGFGVAIAVASALTFDYFLVPPLWSLLAKREDWAMFGPGGGLLDLQACPRSGHRGQRACRGRSRGRTGPPAAAGSGPERRPAQPHGI